MSREFILYADESVVDGKYFSNFYGGLLVRSSDLEEVSISLEELKEKENLTGEIKWQKVTKNYLGKYILMMDEFFNHVRLDKIKVRIMFTQNRFVPTDLEDYHKEHEYFLLYYQFIKHAFGLKYAEEIDKPTRLRIYFDRLPDTKEKSYKFKSYIKSLEKSTGFRNKKIIVPDDQIAEVKSHEHVLLQCVDIVLGSMQFRLNNKHKIKPKGKRRRGKRTIAKEKLYKYINGRIRDIYSNFNIGITTGTNGDAANYWNHPYRHWLFKPSNHEKDDTKTKRADEL